MKAWLLNEFKGLEGLRLVREGVPIPEPADGEVRIRLHYAALNPADRYLAESLYPARPPLPHILGRDGAGVVERAAPDVQWPRPGDCVALLRGEAGVTRWGTFADCVVVPAGILIPIPKGWSEQQAAAAPLVYLTAWQALTQWGLLDKDAVVVVTGASGGVGLACLQLGRALGYRMIALSRHSQKASVLDDNGAALVLSPDAPGLRDAIKEFAGESGVTLAIDNIGGSLLPRVIDTLGPWGKVSCVGRLAGSVPEFNTATLYFRRIRMGGVAVGGYTADEAQVAWQEILKILTRAGYRPLIDTVFTFEQLIDAFERLKGGVLGKVLLEINKPQ